MSLITINKVNCKDCYKCVRYCPVKAIRVINGHAEVVDERCLCDGGCVHVCPQHAKQVRDDVDLVKSLFAAGRRVIASVAPSAAGVYGTKLPQLVGALKKLGFARVEETARTAEAVAKAHAAFAAEGKAVITSSCPAVVALVEKYYPKFTPNLAPVPSPMIAHARLLREEYGDDIAVVFIGPCIAKKGEGEDAGVDAAITFDELARWLQEASISLEQLPAAAFDNPPVGTAELFPVLHGLLKTAGMNDDTTSRAHITVSGLIEVREVLDELDGLKDVRLIEALACKGGCLQGPGAYAGPEPWMRRQHLLAHVQTTTGAGAAPVDMSRAYTCEPLDLPLPTQEEITAILKRTGKHTAADAQNCGACGYESCREKAIAVWQGMAEAEMCIPYMRSRAESFANVVIRYTPNGIVVIDSALRMLDANPAFLRIFGATLNEEVIGRPVKTLLDGSGYERVRRTGHPFTRNEVKYGERVVREMIFPIADEDIIVGLYVDTTDEYIRQQQMQDVKLETLGKAKLVIDKQMRVAQEIAGLLGETTAETKVLLTRLIKLAEAETNDSNHNRK